MTSPALKSPRREIGGGPHMVIDLGAATILFSQINLHHSPVANHSINEWLVGRKGHTTPKIALIQEPHTIKGKITNISKKLDTFSDTCDGNIRSCIITTQGLNAWMLGQFSNADQVAIAIRNGNQTIVAASTYMPYDSEEPPPPGIMKDLTAFCEAKGWGLIIGTDANSHNDVWGSTDTNYRGEELLNFIVGSNLHICNQGNKPTFSNAIRKEVIDITLASNNIVNKISRWEVSDAETFSDHNRIQFEFAYETKEINIGKRNIRNTNWTNYIEELKGNMIPLQEFSTKGVEHMNEMLVKTIIESFEGNCQITNVLTTDKPIWWNRHLTFLKRSAANKRRRYKRHPTEENQELAKAALREYKAEIRKAKTESWKEFCSSIENQTATAKLQKIMKMGGTRKISTLKKKDGSFTTTPEETLEVLIETHFPDAPNQGRNQLSKQAQTEPYTDLSEIVNESAIEAAMKSFLPYKSPGVDGIYPALLQKGMPVLKPYIRLLYLNSLREGTLPTKWTEIKAVFIPKPGKKDTMDPKSYRPISLTSFLLKGLERLIHWHITCTNLKQKPLHPNLYSYREGVSTENALHRVIHKIERAMAQNNFAIVVFLDISGAFSDASINGMVNSLKNRGINSTIIRWIEEMLKKRKMIAQLHGESIEKSLDRGTPQGGILSPTLFNLDVEECLELIPQSGPTEGHGFADDILDIGVGIDEKTIANNLQKDLRKFEDWAKAHSLSFNTEKSKVMIFTRKNKYKKPKLYLSGRELEYVNEIKYLGVIIDQKLSWKQHIESQIKKATNVLMMSRKMIGNKWGLKPKIMDWIYKGIVRPTLSYGSIVWISGLNRKFIQEKLSRVQRKACLMITRGIQSTPTAGMEVILDILPLHIYIKGEAIKSYVRIKRQPMGTKGW